MCAFCCTQRQAACPGAALAEPPLSNEASQDSSLDSLHARTGSPKAWPSPVVQAVCFRAVGLYPEDETAATFCPCLNWCVLCCVVWCPGLAPPLLSSPGIRCLSVTHPRRLLERLFTTTGVCLPCLQGCFQSEGVFWLNDQEPSPNLHTLIATSAVSMSLPHIEACGLD